MMTEQEYEQKRSDVWRGVLTGYPSKRWEYANWFLLRNPKSDFAHYRMGITLLKQSAIQGLSRAQGDLAYHLYYGKGVDKDEKKALEWCNKALEIMKRPEWVRLHNVITRPKENITLSNAQMGLYRAFLHHDINHIESRLDENVVFSNLFCYPSQGKMDVLENLKEFISDKEMKVSLLPTERYGMVTETYVPNNIRTLIRSIYFVRTNEKNKIDRIARQPIVWDKYCFSAGDSPFCWEEIEPCLDNVVEKGITRGLMFCPECGKLSHELKWIHFQSRPDPVTGFSYLGRMSVCTECKRQVEFHCDGVKKSW